MKGYLPFFPALLKTSIWALDQLVSTFQLQQHWALRFSLNSSGLAANLPFFTISSFFLDGQQLFD